MNLKAVILSDKINKILKKKGLKYNVYLAFSPLTDIDEYFWTIRRDFDNKVLLVRSVWEYLEWFVDELDNNFEYFKFLFEDNRNEK